jgi:hypothetical protein
MLKASEQGITLFRNNVGTGWAGKVQRGPYHGHVDLASTDIIIYGARPLHAGLCKGSADLIGWKTITVTPDMVGQQLAVFTGVEVKQPRGRVSKEQQHFGNTLANAGGLFTIARSPADVEGL